MIIPSDNAADILVLIKKPDKEGPLIAYHQRHMCLNMFFFHVSSHRPLEKPALFKLIYQEICFVIQKTLQCKGKNVEKCFVTACMCNCFSDCTNSNIPQSTACLGLLFF